MSKMFYPKLALTNLGKNRRMYVPYIAACTITAAMLYMMASIASNPGLEMLPKGSRTITGILGFGVWVCIIFIAIFLFYTNSFLIKSRKKEFGLYNILGMEKRHIARVIGFEMLYTAVISATLGILLGVLFDKLAFMLLLKLFEAEVPLGFSFSPTGAITVVALYVAVFFLIFLNSVRQVHFSKPIELLRGGNMGEREPKTKWIMAILGAAALAGGYIISISTENPVKALSLFFVAVILVIIGTYFLFIAGSVVFLKLLRRNKAYYYKTSHFIGVSGMLYRMKQNAVGLASICILSTMVIVTISSTLSLWAGMNDMFSQRYPRDFSVQFATEKYHSEIMDETKALIDEKLSGSGIKPSNEVFYRYANHCATRDGNEFTAKFTEKDDPTQIYQLVYVPLEDYNRCMGVNKSLNEGEILLYVNRGEYRQDEITINGVEYRIAEKLDGFMVNSETASLIYTSYCIVLPTIEDVAAAEAKCAEIEEDYWTAFIGCYYAFDVAYENGEKPDLASQEHLEYKLYKELDSFKGEWRDSEGHSYGVECRADIEQEFREMYGGLFFIGVFLGLLFSIAAVLIIYYKQISEGYDDRERFIIMRKVGLSHSEVRKAIRSQVLTVFFMPLVAAGIHMAFAFPAIYRILTLLCLSNIGLFVGCTLAVFGVFALMYAAVYLITAQSYYRIVSE